MSIAIEVGDLQFSYPSQQEDAGIPVFKDLSLKIQEGSFVAVLGHNGCGKSTLAKHFNAILLPEAVSVFSVMIQRTKSTLLISAVLWVWSSRTPTTRWLPMWWKRM